jgi:hypothetical protein
MPGQIGHLAGLAMDAMFLKTFRGSQLSPVCLNLKTMLFLRRPATFALLYAATSASLCTSKDSPRDVAASSMPTGGRKLRVGVLGATGTVGQQFLKYLDNVSIMTCIVAPQL